MSQSSGVRISSDESEGLFNEFIEERLDELIEGILNDGDIDRFSDRGSDIIIEMDDVVPPTFVYGDDADGGDASGQRPGTDKGKLRFRLPFHTFMNMMGQKLRLPDLLKEGTGRIKEFTNHFKSFGQVGVVLDKRRTFRRALRSSIGLGTYDPARGKHVVQVRRRDRRFKVPLREEKPKHRAVVLYMGDISYSTQGERLKMEKRLVNIIHQWVDFNYGAGSVEHRFFVHDSEAYEVSPEDFYKVSNAGGTQAAPVFDLIAQVAFNEYDVASTNFYAFYFGDGEVFEADAKKIVTVIDSDIRPHFSRLGIVEVQPSKFSYLSREIKKQFDKDRVVRLGRIHQRSQTIDVIKTLFEGRDAKH